MNLTELYLPQAEARRIEEDKQAIRSQIVGYYSTGFLLGTVANDAYYDEISFAPDFSRETPEEYSSYPLGFSSSYDQMRMLEEYYREMMMPTYQDAYLAGDMRTFFNQMLRLKHDNDSSELFIRREATRNLVAIATQSDLPAPLNKTFSPVRNQRSKRGCFVHEPSQQILTLRH